MAHRNASTSIGISFSENPKQAGAEAARNAILKLGTKPKFGFLFCSEKRFSDKNSVNTLVRSAHGEFLKANPNFEWAGCTTQQVGGCVALVANSKNIHFGIGIGNHTRICPISAGENAAKEAISKVDLDKHILSYISSLEHKKNQLDVEKIHPFLMTMLTPKESNLNEIHKGVINIVGSRAPVSKEVGYTFSNGILFSDAAVLLLQAFDKDGDWHNFQNKWLSSIFGPGL